jgi:AcrR family transcriptional regulator
MKSSGETSEESDRRRAARRRLVEAGLLLFARQGFDATSIAEIETEAGFAPRSGALYQYFPSKRALLDAGLEHHLESVDSVATTTTEHAPGSVRDELARLAHWLLAELDRERHITHLLEREGERLTDLRDRAREGISEKGYRIGADIIEQRLPNLTSAERDIVSVAAIGALVNFRRSTWTFGAPPRDLADDDFVDGWVDLFFPLLGHDAGT